MPDQYREPIEEIKPEGEARNRSGIQREILELEQKLAEKKAEQEKAIEEALGLEKPQATASAQTQTAAPALPKKKTVKDDAQKFSGLDKSQQLQGLVNLAFEKGATHATEVVKKLDNPNLLDEFHDILIDKFRGELVKRGKLEEM